MNRIKKFVFCTAVCVFILVLFSRSNFSHVGVRFYKTSGGFSCIPTVGGRTDESAHIPKHIHQMFFNMTDTAIPERLETARQTWVNKHTGFKYTLWNSTMIENLITNSYPQLRDLYHSYSHWVRRADMGRYLVLQEFGGIYIDLDIKSSGKQLDQLYQTFQNSTGVVLYLTNPPVVSNDFMLSKAKHPFMKEVLCGLEGANHWYVLPYITTMYSTGPMYLHSKFKSYSNRHEIGLLEESVMKNFVRHISGASWHQWDGILIWWIFLHLKQFLTGCFVVLFFTLVLALICRYRITLRKSLSNCTCTRKILECCNKRRT